MPYLFEKKLEFPDGHHHPEHASKMVCQDVDFWYGDTPALKGVNLEIFKNETLAFIGPSGCGKSTLLRCLNRTNDIIPGARLEGRITLDGIDLYDPHHDPTEIRQRFGWVAQKPNPFPSSVYSNIAYGPRIRGQIHGKAETDALVQRCLERVGMWDEVKDRLDDDGTDLSGGQQQRLCIARAIPYQPDLILMDEPCSALDPTATARIEQLIDELRDEFTVVIVTHNMQQAARVAQRTAFFHLGELVEVADTETLFTNAEQPRCRDYILGRYG
jgi:phosphate transport system ATP-binding protein